MALAIVLFLVLPPGHLLLAAVLLLFPRGPAQPPHFPAGHHSADVPLDALPAPHSPAAPPADLPHSPAPE